MIHNTQYTLAPYATQPHLSNGRLFASTSCSVRDPFQRDRDRIIHTTAFRRLEYKTQVFVNHEGDHYRTRLTHSIEVAQISRTLAKALHLHEDLTEVCALAHDIGHPPFGHAGEDALNDAAKQYGGFDHNAQALRLLTELEQRFIEFDGLNLTWESLEGIIKHNGPLIGPYADLKRYANGPHHAINRYNALHDLWLQSFPSLEAQVAGVCDDIAYNNHDMEDGIRAGFFTLEELCSIPLVYDSFSELKLRYPKADGRRLVYQTIGSLIGKMVEDVIRTTQHALHAQSIQTVGDVRQSPNFIVSFSDEMELHNKQLKYFLKDRMYSHPEVTATRDVAKTILGTLYHYYFDNPNKLTPKWQAYMVDKNDLQRRSDTVVNYIAGMTDRYASQRYTEITGNKPKWREHE
ncbi:MAG: deoxyguanosinetriphosphate triphosphohydrolase [Alphaproteobacteria bacterium]|nr:deoxyguanosinetriphosphate triphosphohydrolase [Alphaproteobacteria bacterium]